MKVYLETHSTNENWNPCAPILEVTITLAVLRRIKRARRALKRMNKDGLSVAEIYLYSNPVSDWGLGYYEDGQPFDYSGTDEGGGSSLRTDLDRIEVLDGFFLFSAWAKDSDVRFSTDVIDFDDRPLVYLSNLHVRATPPWKR